MIQFVIVLGNSDPKILIPRLNKGIEEFNKNKKYYDDYQDEEETFGVYNYIILSGGGRGGKGPKISDKMYKSEAEYMHEYVSKFIDSKYIILEDLSKDTIENLINSYKIISTKYSVSEYSINVTICTSSFHLKRSIVLATLLNKDGYNLRFAHTYENFTDEVNKRELRHLDNFMNNYCNNLPK